MLSQTIRTTLHLESRILLTSILPVLKGHISTWVLSVSLPKHDCPTSSSYRQYTELSLSSPRCFQGLTPSEYLSNTVDINQSPRLLIASVIAGNKASQYVMQQITYHIRRLSGKRRSTSTISTSPTSHTLPVRRSKLTEQQTYIHGMTLTERNDNSSRWHQNAALRRAEGFRNTPITMCNLHLLLNSRHAIYSYATLCHRSKPPRRERFKRQFKKEFRTTVG